MEEALGLSTVQAARRLGVTPKTVRNWIRCGRLKAMRLKSKCGRGRYRIPMEEVRKVLEL